MISVFITSSFVVALLLIPSIIVTLQVACSFLPQARRRQPVGPGNASFAVLVPAHNEATVIEETLSSIVPQLGPRGRIVVVADNCSDSTARLARKAGAEVIERSDAIRRGKGFALDFGVRHLEKDPPEVVVVVDADCRVEPGTVTSLVRFCAAESRPVQAAYFMLAPTVPLRRHQIAEFAWLVKNYARPLGSHRLGLPCQLMGTGMAFPWHSLRDAKLASPNIVEDLVLGLDLASSGHPPLFCPEARVTSQFPTEEQGTASQRTRWEHGHLAVILGLGPKLIARALAKGDLKLLAMVLDACVPPLALLFLLTLFTIVAAGMLHTYGGSRLPLILALIAAAMLCCAVLGAWWRYGREAISFNALALAPYYAAAKIPLYAKFLVRRQADWVRSRRKGE